MLKLQGSLGHVMALTPLLDTGDVIVDLQTSFPREEVAAHEQVVESGYANKTQELVDCLCDDRVFQVVSLHGAENIIQKCQQIVHAVRRLRVRLEELAKETAALVGDETG